MSFLLELRVLIKLNKKFSKWQTVDKLLVYSNQKNDDKYSLSQCIKMQNNLLERFAIFEKIFRLRPANEHPTQKR